MSIYNLNFTQKTIEMLPPDKRYNKTLAWFRSLIKPIQWLHTKYFIDYRTGSSYPLWSAGTYNKGDRVTVTPQNSPKGLSVFESTIDNNTEAPNVITGNWIVYLDSFIGVDELLKYTSQRMTLEYALNKRFGGTFRQPPLVSDIYIDNNPLLGTNDYIVHIPVALVPTGMPTFSRAFYFRAFIDQYNPIGVTYTIQTY